jgi:hypothetical protein
MKVEEALMVLKQAVTPQFNNPRTLEAFNTPAPSTAETEMS